MLLHPSSHQRQLKNLCRARFDNSRFTRCQILTFLRNPPQPKIQKNEDLFTPSFASTYGRTIPPNLPIFETNTEVRPIMEGDSPLRLDNDLQTTGREPRRQAVPWSVRSIELLTLNHFPTASLAEIRDANHEYSKGGLPPRNLQTKPAVISANTSLLNRKTPIPNHSLTFASKYVKVMANSARRRYI